MDRDFCFGEDMYIRFTLAPSNKIGYTTTSGPGVIQTTVVSSLFTNQPTVTLQLQVAYQDDPFVAASSPGETDDWWNDVHRSVPLHVEEFVPRWRESVQSGRDAEQWIRTLLQASCCTPHSTPLETRVF